jgi:hypothetical protein
MLNQNRIKRGEKIFAPNINRSSRNGKNRVARN